MGGQIEHRVINAADFGAPTTRKRLYVIIRLDGRPIAWPERTHASRKDAERLGLKPWRGACEIIDFSLDCPSLFLDEAEVEALRKATGKRVKRPVVSATERRVYRGCDRYILSAERPYLVEPGRAAGSVVPITQKGWGGDRAHGVRDPLKTLTSSKGGEFALSEVELAHAAALASVAHGEEARAWPVDDPARTQTGKHDKALVTGTLVPRYGERDGQAPRCLDIEEPAPCAVPTGNGGSLAAVSLHQMNTRDVGASVLDPTRAQPGHDHQALQAATLIRQFGTTTARDVREPHPTVMTEGGGGKSGVSVAFMAQGNAGRVGRAASDPTTTQTERGTQQQLVAASLDTYYTTGSSGADVAAPARTSTGKDRMSLVAYWLEQANTGMVGHPATAPVSTIVAGGGPKSGWAGATQRLVAARLEQDGGPIGRRDKVLEFLWRHAGLPTVEEWENPTATLDARRKFGLVIIDGVTWMIVDIGLRMLTPAELAAAMGLPPEYDLSVDFAGKAISKTHQTQMIGNMVSPPPAAALIAANCPDLIQPGWGPGVTEPERRAA
jgi:DNA (cytosine-5)-methyltransferase 1